MSEIKWLNKLLLLENILCIYRCYCTQEKAKKCLIISQIFVFMITHGVLFIINMYFLLRLDINTFQLKLVYVFFEASSHVSFVSSIMSGICYSHAFISYYRSISRVSIRFRDGPNRIRSFKKLFWFSLGVSLFSTFIAVFRGVNVVINSSQLHSLILVYPTLVSLALIRITIEYQYFMFYVVIMIVVQLLKCLASLVSDFQERVGKCDISSDEQSNCTREQIKEWVELYRDLVNCYEKVALCFGRQFLFSLIISTTRFIMITYQTVYLKLFNMEDIYEYRQVVIALFGYISVTMMPLVAGQVAKNEGVRFHRMLARLYNTMIIHSNETELKSIKDFIRLIKKNPVEIKLLSNIPAGHYILPVMVTLAVNYAIFMLQFNHII